MLINIQYFGTKNRDNWPKIENSKPDSLFWPLGIMGNWDTQFYFKGAMGLVKLRKSNNKQLLLNILFLWAFICKLKRHIQEQRGMPAFSERNLNIGNTCSIWRNWKLILHVACLQFTELVATGLRGHPIHSMTQSWHLPHRYIALIDSGLCKFFNKFWLEYVLKL